MTKRIAGQFSLVFTPHLKLNLPHRGAGGTHKEGRDHAPASKNTGRLCISANCVHKATVHVSGVGWLCRACHRKFIHSGFSEIRKKVYFY
jgi:hypothetical protein